MDKEKINDLGLIDLKKYACPKVQHKREWYWDCIDNCPGFATCKVGQRASAILESATTKEEEPKAISGREAYHARRKEEARARCKAAVESGNPIKWCEENGSPNHNAAKKLVQRWKYEFYDLFGMSEPRQIVRNKGQDAALKARKEATEDKIRTAIESGNIEQWLMDHGKTERQAKDAHWRWKRTYPEIFEEYENKKMNTDEISLDDFVSQYDDVIHISYSPSNEPAETADEPAETAGKPESKEDNFLDQLTVKRSSLVLEKEQLEAEIRERQDKIAVLDKQIEALANVYTLFE